MTSKPTDTPSPTQHIALRHHLIDNPGASAAATAQRTFEMRFTSTPRGARLARRLAAVRLDAWGVPYGTDAHDAIVLIVAELTANAVVHGHVPGRDFHLRLHLHADARSTTVRAEVTDTRAERVPPRPGAVVLDPAPDAAESGRGLLLVVGLATRWDWHPRPDGPGKTIWAEYALDDGVSIPEPAQSRQTGL
ncbi:ATP-binding protein [Streptomyces tendae]|uniref:ATP-binding protein n=1 Tax=Streptomyces tendae TaxID=1932 RepID=UPI00371D9C25